MSETQLPKIEKGIPLPKGKEKHGGCKAVLNTMEAGDSVLVSSKHANSLRQTAWTLGIKVCTRKVSETETRIWRMS